MDAEGKQSLALHPEFLCHSRQLYIHRWPPLDLAAAAPEAASDTTMQTRLYLLNPLTEVLFIVEEHNILLVQMIGKSCFLHGYKTPIDFSTILSMPNER